MGRGWGGGARVRRGGDKRERVRREEEGAEETGREVRGEEGGSEGRSGG